jgi:polyisoprenoid-binding protein YceI
MGRGTVFTIALVMFSVGVAVGILGITWFVGGTGTPSEPISAPTLSLNPTLDPNGVSTQVAALDGKLDTVLAQLETGTDAEAMSTVSAQIAVLQSEIAALNSAVDLSDRVLETPEVIPTDIPTPKPTRQPTTASVSSAIDLRGRSLFRIDNSLSSVRFEIDEQLSGLPNHVIGVTDQLAGDIIVDFDQPANSQVGEIRINARTFATDSEIRNRALRSEILESSKPQYEFITFQPTEIRGLPEQVTIGNALTFQVLGSLTIRSISSPVTFDVNATLVSVDELDGSATAHVTRDAFDLTIPSVPNVANVTNDVLLGIDFAARLVENS